MDNLLVGKLILPFGGGCLPLCCPAPSALWKLIRRSRTRFRDRPKTVRHHPGFGVRLRPGSLFGIIPDWRSASSRNRVHVPQESPLLPNHTFKPADARPVRGVSGAEADERGAL